jgi:hypothetical protein
MQVQVILSLQEARASPFAYIGAGQSIVHILEGDLKASRTATHTNFPAKIFTSPLRLFASQAVQPGASGTAAAGACTTWLTSSRSSISANIGSSYS